MKTYRFQVPRELDFEVMEFVKAHDLKGSVSLWGDVGAVFHLSIPEDLVVIMKLKYDFELMLLPEISDDVRPISYFLY